VICDRFFNAGSTRFKKFVDANPAFSHQYVRTLLPPLAQLAANPKRQEKKCSPVVSKNKLMLFFAPWLFLLLPVSISCISNGLCQPKRHGAIFSSIDIDNV